MCVPFWRPVLAESVADASGSFSGSVWPGTRFLGGSIESYVGAEVILRALAKEFEICLFLWVVGREGA